MPTKLRDILKRKCAQTANHQSAAILDLNDVYEEFAKTHPAEAERLKVLMLNQNTLRDALLAFVRDTWGIDEDQLQGYI